MPAPLFATVIHLTTGHVLAAVTSAGLKPTLEELTADSHLRVRFPGTHSYVDVPIKLLRSARVAVTTDVLDAPQHYTFDPASGQPAPGLPPVVGAAYPTAPAGTKAVVVWHDLADSPYSDKPLATGGALPATPPPGATQQLLAIEGVALHLNELP